MIRHASNGPDTRDADQKAYSALERLLADLRAGKVTGQWKLFGNAHQGGVTVVEAEYTVRPKVG